MRGGSLCLDLASPTPTDITNPYDATFVATTVINRRQLRDFTEGRA